MTPQTVCTIKVYDEGHATHSNRSPYLLQKGKVESIEVVIERMPSTKNTIRGVIQKDLNDVTKPSTLGLAARRLKHFAYKK